MEARKREYDTCVEASWLAHQASNLPLFKWPNQLNIILPASLGPTASTINSSDTANRYQTYNSKNDLTLPTASPKFHFSWRNKGVDNSLFYHYLRSYSINEFPSFKINESWYFHISATIHTAVTDVARKLA